MPLQRDAPGLARDQPGYRIGLDVASLREQVVLQSVVHRGSVGSLVIGTSFLRQGRIPFLLRPAFGGNGPIPFLVRSYLGCDGPDARGPCHVSLLRCFGRMLLSQYTLLLRADALLSRHTRF